jgi:O-antigen/teichoic acid export membrane protein
MIPDTGLAGDLPVNIETPLAPRQVLPAGVARRVLGGTSALAVGISIERGCGFLANVLAARFAGAPAFGAYSLAISTANNISTYAAGGIGATATRFSGKYAYGSPGYATLARALSIVSLVSAGIAAVALWAGAGPIAELLHKTTLTGLLRWAAISACGIILLECARGFFVGQRRLAAVVTLSLLVGIGMVSLLPWAARSHHPTRMIISQGAVTLTAVAACLLLARPLGLVGGGSGIATLPLGHVLHEVWGFGLIQLAGLVGSNLSGWWLIALVARADTTLVQMSFFAIASQLRNLVGLAPGMLTEGSYAVMADPTNEHLRTPHHVMAICTFAATSMSLLIASLGMIVLPYGLAMYGHAYRGAAATAAIGLAIAVVHMGNAPAAARLSIVSIRATGVINTVWAIFVAAGGTLLLLHGGSAALAMLVFFAAHVISASLVLAVLARKDHVPAGMVSLFVLSAFSILILASLALLRARRPAHDLLFDAIMMGMFLLSASAMLLLGKRHCWLPTTAAIRNLRLTLTSKVRRILRVVTGGKSYGA